VTDERERERGLSFVASQTGRRVQQHVELCLGRQFAVLGGDAASNFVQLLAERQVVFQHDEQLFQLHGDRNDG